MLLVILEHENGELVEAAREALTFGRTLAEKMGEDLEAPMREVESSSCTSKPRPFTQHPGSSD